MNDLTIRQNIELRDLNTNLAKKVEERTRVISQKKDELGRLYKELEKNFFDSIRVFVEILELYNPSFGKHSKRTALFSRMIAINAGLKEKEIESVEIAAMLHDIGMIGIPKEILDAEPDSLEGEKRYMYEQHPVMGQAAIKQIKKLDAIGEIIRSHHEKFDGSGYPDGLKAEQIPIEARIVAVADYYDEIHAMGAYHIKSSDTDAIKNFIAKNSRTMFDSSIVQHLFHVLDSLKNRSSKEKQVSIDELAEGMVVSRDVYTRSGLFLVSKDTILNGIYISKIKNYKKLGCIIEDKVYTH